MKLTQEKPPTPATEHVVFQTDAGDLSIELYPDAAPREVAQFLKLVRAGVYDHFSVTRVEPGRYAMFAAGRERAMTWSPDQRQLFAPMPVEASALRHERWMLSLWHPEQDARGETTFTLMLGDNPPMDGKFTVFGKVAAGTGTVNMIEAAHLDGEFQPIAPIRVDHAWVAPNPQALLAFQFRDGVQFELTDPWIARERILETSRAAITILAGSMAVALVLVFFARKLTPRFLSALGVGLAMVSGFALLIFLLPMHNRNKLLGALIFLGLAGLLRLMRRADSEPPAGGQLTP